MMARRLLRKRPDPPAADNVPLEVGERSDDLAESRTWDTDFNIVVGPVCRRPDARPPGRDIPRGGDTRHSLPDLGWNPRLPEPDALRPGRGRRDLWRPALNGLRFRATGIARLNVPSTTISAPASGHHHVEHAVITPTNHLVLPVHRK